MSRMDFDLTELQASVQREARAIAAQFDLDYWREHDRSEAYPWEFVRAFAAAGWLGALIPEAYGGAGLGLTEAGLVLQAIGASGAGTSGASAVHFYVFPLTPVIRHGSVSLKATYLPAAARGELLVAFGVTEPGAGTDTSRIITSAQRQGDGWVVHGQKVWTTNAQNAQRILLLVEVADRSARYDRDAKVPATRKPASVRSGWSTSSTIECSRTVIRRATVIRSCRPFDGATRSLRSASRTGWSRSMTSCPDGV